MWIKVTGTNMEVSDQLREWAESRLRRAIRPFDEQIRYAICQIRHSDSGSPGYACLMDASIQSGRTIEVEQRGADAYRIVAAAAQLLRERLEEQTHRIQRHH